MQINVARCECNPGVRQSFQLVVLSDAQKHVWTVALQRSASCRLMLTWRRWVLAWRMRSYCYGAELRHLLVGRTLGFVTSYSKPALSDSDVPQAGYRYLYSCCLIQDDFFLSLQILFQQKRWETGIWSRRRSPETSLGRAVGAIRIASS